MLTLCKACPWTFSRAGAERAWVRVSLFDRWEPLWKSNELEQMMHQSPVAPGDTVGVQEAGRVILSYHARNIEVTFFQSKELQTSSLSRSAWSLHPSGAAEWEREREGERGEVGGTPLKEVGFIWEVLLWRLTPPHSPYASSWGCGCAFGASLHTWLWLESRTEAADGGGIDLIEKQNTRTRARRHGDALLCLLWRGRGLPLMPCSTAP